MAGVRLSALGLPLAALLALAAGLGLLAGLRAIPPDETEIILRHAADYVDRTGGLATDCLARPSPLEGVRLVVVCDPAGAEAWVVAVDHFGNPVDVPRTPPAAEPST